MEHQSSHELFDMSPMSEVADDRRYWRSLSELENSPEFEAMLHREFPQAASEFPQGVSRRRWLQLMGASLALAGMAGCRYREEKIVPLSARPVDRVPGKPQRYATSIELAGGVRHLLVTCYDGRPLKVEGNSDHPFSGGTDVFAQACILDLYDPDRGHVVRQRAGSQVIAKTWTDFDQAVLQWSAEWRSVGGQGLALLVEPTHSESLRRLVARFRDAFPQARLYQHASISDAAVREGSRQAFGQVYRTHLALDRAAVIVSLDTDLFAEGPAALRMARDFVAGRDVGRDGKGPMSRLYAVESQYSLTGVMADHRLAVRSSDIPAVLGELERMVERGLEGAQLTVEDSAPMRQRMLQAIAQDLVAHAGRGVIAVGLRQPAAVHARVHRLNSLLNNAGQTVLYTREPAAEGEFADLSALAADLDAERVQSLLILGGNPVYDAPADVDLLKSLARVPLSVHLSFYENETSRACHWYLPQTHAFEAWGDATAYDGTLSVGQPLIEPLLDGRSPLELLAQVLGEPADAQAIVRQAMQQRRGEQLSDEQWRRLLHDGFLADSQAETVTPVLAETPAEAAADPAQAAPGLELVFCPDSMIYDGRFANNSWLQETPRLLTKLTWDNAALISPATARRLGVAHGTLVQLQVEGRSLEIPAFVLPGQADDSIGVALGYGRQEAGRVGGSASQAIAVVGANANRVRTSGTMFVATGVELTPTKRVYPLATTQDHHAIDMVGMQETYERVGALVRERDLADYRTHPEGEHADHHPPLRSLWEEHSYEGHAWGMAIDLNKCIGCNACVVACQAENNVPVVGKDQVARGREMHWIRIDRYFRGGEDDPQVVHQPMTCQQCENAPCEAVCPVAATVHSDEGLNDMVYNRCVGTRYCANNCPYKVRRFNFFNNTKSLHAQENQLVQLVVNPEVTVRSRGVMEKCTYCVQRIQHVKIDAKNERRAIRDGEIMTACQQACPTRAIEFGDLNQSGSRVAQARSDPRAYGILVELNVKPRTNYLARIRNPHPNLTEPQHVPQPEPARGHV